METLPKAYDQKEYLRMAILKHEETFKQQVHELHRLYVTQKTLMKKIEKSKKNGCDSEGWYTRNEICFSQIYDQDTRNHRGSTRTTKLDLEQPAEDEADADNGGVAQTINESEIELTLGPSSYNTSDSGITLSSSSTGSCQEQVKGQEMEVLGVIGTSSPCQNESNMRVNKRMDCPSWLCQVSLNT